MAALGILNSRCKTDWSWVNFTLSLLGKALSCTGAVCLQTQADDAVSGSDLDHAGVASSAIEARDPFKNQNLNSAETGSWTFLLPQDKPLAERAGRLLQEKMLCKKLLWGTCLCYRLRERVNPSP